VHQQRRLVDLVRALGLVEDVHPEHAAIAEDDSEDERGDRADPDGRTTAGEIDQLLGHGSSLTLLMGVVVLQSARRSAIRAS
jgi:hypothetical protein